MGVRGEQFIQPIAHNSKCISSRHLYQIKVPNRDKVMEYLNSNKIYPGVHYKDNTKYTMYTYANGSCPNAEKQSKQIISLPLHLFLSDEEISYIIMKVKDSVKV